MEIGEKELKVKDLEVWQAAAYFLHPDPLARAIGRFPAGHFGLDISGDPGRSTSLRICALPAPETMKDHLSSMIKDREGKGDAEGLKFFHPICHYRARHFSKSFAAAERAKQYGHPLPSPRKIRSKRGQSWLHQVEELA